MEPTTSAITIATVSFQLTVAIYDILTNIKDGPANVAQCASAVALLQGALKQLSQIPNLQELVGFEALDLEVRKCSDFLKSFVSKLGKLQIFSTDTGCRVAWKRVKAVLDEKDLDRMAGTISAHFAALSLWLQSAQG